MATASNGRVLPELPSADSTRRDAPRRAESVSSPAADVTKGDGKRLPRWMVPAVQAALTGGSVVHAPGLSLAQTWTRHAQAASHYKTIWARWPRYAWGGLHTALTAVLRTVEWVTDSPPKLFTAAVVVAACWYWS